MQQWEKDFNRAVDEYANKAANSIGKGISNFFKGVFHGAKKLKDRKFLIGFIVSICATIGALVFKRRIATIENFIWRYLIYYGLLLSPLLYLKYISSIGIDRNLGEKLIQAGIICQDGKAPFLIDKSKNKKGYDVLTFSGTCKLEEWKKKKGDIEVALDLTILDIEQGKSKKIVKVTTVPPGCAMPEKIEWDDKYIVEKDGVVNLGNNGVEDILLDFNKDPHVIVGGATGSGKSVILRAILWQFIKQGHIPIMADFKNGLEFGENYKKFGEVITDKERLLEVLTMLEKENELRQELLKKYNAKDLVSLNKKSKENLKRVIVLIDEVAEVLDSQGIKGEEKALMEQISAKMASFSRISRVTGIHLLLGVQRPDAKVITGQLKSNCNGRICGRVPDGVASEIVLDNTMAAKLPKIPGRMLFSNGAECVEFQSYYFDDDSHLKDISNTIGKLLVNRTKVDGFEVNNISTDNLEDDQFVMQDNLGDSIIDETYETDDEFESGNIDWNSLKEKNTNDDYEEWNK